MGELQKIVVETRTEEMVYCGVLPLRLSFTPDAIREHFENCGKIQNMSDEELAAIGSKALVHDFLYDAYHEALVDALEYDPDEDEVP